MGFQILPQAQPKQASLGKRFSNAVGTGLETGGRMLQEQRQKEAIGKALGADAQNLPPEMQKLAYQAKLSGENERAKRVLELQGNQQQINAIEDERGLERGTLKQFVNDPAMAERISKPKADKAPPGGLGGIPIPKEKANAISKIVKENPNATAEELELLFNEAEIEPGYTSKLLESRRQTEQRSSASKDAKEAQLRAETLPMKKEIADKAQAAQQGIENKHQLLDLIKNGDINDPTVAALAEALPLNLGKRLLSNDTVQYKAGLIEEFGDLKNLFKGTTRVKEIELLQEKIADLYLTDDQKEAVLKSRINALQRDVILAEVAADMESEGVNYPLLTYQQELNKRAKPKLDALFNRILDEHKAVFQDAENKKKIPLNFSDPDDKRIAEELIKEAGGDRAKARELAKKKGYTF